MLSQTFLTRMLLVLMLTVACASSTETVVNEEPTLTLTESTPTIITSAIPTAWNISWLRQIDVSGEAPDLVGINEVSDFYGPGAWSAWFLTLCGSWLHLYSDDSTTRPDLNTWSFLAYTNWAAMDLILHALQMHRYLLQGENTAWQKMGASVAAPLTVVFWACLHCVGQIWASFIGGTERHKSRRKTVFCGSILPVAALALSIACLTDYDNYFIRIPNGGIAEGYIPAHYCRLGNGGFHLDSMGWAAYSLATVYSIVLLVLLFTRTPFRAVAESRMVSGPFLWISHSPERTAPILFIISIIGFVAFFTIFTESGTIHAILSPWIIGGNLMLFVLLGLLFVMWEPFSLIGHLFHSYVWFDGTVSQCCVFMPCSSYSITDMSQASSLFAAMVLFFGGEVGLPLYSRMKQKRKEKKVLEVELQEAGRKIDAARRVNTGTLEEGLSGGGIVRRQTSGLGGKAASE